MSTTIKENYTETIPNGPSFDMIFVEGGSFMMGNDDNSSYEKPVHGVTVPDFYMAKYPVTQALWQAVMGANPSYFKGANRPVERVSWDDIQIFIKKLNTLTGKTYRLPSEAEWEYAARGGKQTNGFVYAGSNRLEEVGWYNDNSHSETKPVGLKLPNELELYDMSGNVWEWCADMWHANYKGAPKDGSAWMRRWRQTGRVVRGGSWVNFIDICRVSIRNYNVADDWNDYFGFRLAGY